MASCWWRRCFQSRGTDNTIIFLKCGLLVSANDDVATDYALKNDSVIFSYSPCKSYCFELRTLYSKSKGRQSKKSNWFLNTFYNPSLVDNLGLTIFIAVHRSQQLTTVAPLDQFAFASNFADLFDFFKLKYKALTSTSLDHKIYYWGVPVYLLNY